jgi:hypothetical protein
VAASTTQQCCHIRLETFIFTLRLKLRIWQRRCPSIRRKGEKDDHNSAGATGTGLLHCTVTKSATVLHCTAQSQTMLQILAHYTVQSQTMLQIRAHWSAQSQTIL